MQNALSTSIALLGDTQETMLVERAVGREHNLLESKILVNDLAANAPQRLFMLGDSVSVGSLASDWEKFDKLMTPLLHKSISVEGILGNHDYFFGGDCLKHAYVRYPKLKVSHWYSEVIQDVGFLFLDSNKRQLGESRWNDQKKWLEEKITTLDNDDSIRGFFILGHHPPFTNSKVTSDDKNSKNDFAPSLFKSKKGLGYISGHAHGYEHFENNGFHFIVSGGGGGPRVNYHVGENKRHQDLYQGAMPRPFNYLLLSLEADGVTFIARGLSKGEDKIFEFDRFFIGFKK